MNAVQKEYIPTMQEELDRKAVETFEDLYLKYKAGDITTAELKAAVKVAFNLVSGFISDDILTMLEMIDSELNANDPSFIQWNLFFHHASPDVVVLTARSPDRLSARAIQAKMTEYKLLEGDDAVKKLKALHANLPKKGYEQFLPWS